MIRVTMYRLGAALSLPLLMAWAQSSQPRRNKQPEIREIRATGCVRKASAGRCLILTTLDGESTYGFIAAPRPDAGTVITIQGKPHQGATECKEGLAIDVIDWEPTGEKCSE